MSVLSLALDGQGQVVGALTAPKGARYTCLACGGSLSVKRGGQRVAHFFHISGDPVGCAGESVIHLAAKRLLLTQLQSELAADQHVRWNQHCPGVRKSCRMQAVLPKAHEVEGNWHVREEVTHGRYRFDVAVVVEGQVVFGFEVYHRHRVPEQKAADLDVPWLELVAEEVLEFKPRVPFRDSHSKHLCPDCQLLQLALVEQEKREARRSTQTVRYAAEVMQVQQTWQKILSAARNMDEQQRLRRMKLH